MKKSMDNKCLAMCSAEVLIPGQIQGRGAAEICAALCAMQQKNPRGEPRGKVPRIDGDSDEESGVRPAHHGRRGTPGAEETQSLPVNITPTQRWVAGE